MQTDLVQIRGLGQRKAEENRKLREHLKRHPVSERILKKIAGEVQDAADCRACANCCRVATAKLTGRDIERLSRATRLSPQRFLAEYATASAEEGWVLRRTDAGCVFLNGNDCLIYEDRPAACRAFPHLTSGAGSLMSRMWDMPDRATYCPIVYDTLEAIKATTRFSG